MPLTPGRKRSIIRLAVRGIVTLVRAPAPFIAAIVCALLWSDARPSMARLLEMDGQALDANASHGLAVLTTAQVGTPDAADPASDREPEDGETYSIARSELASPDCSHDRASSFTGNFLIRFDPPPELRVSIA